jgi:hypothetical protein
MERDTNILIPPSQYPKMHDYFGGKAHICSVREVERFLTKTMGWFHYYRAMAAIMTGVGVAKHVVASADHALGSLDRPLVDTDPDFGGLDYYVVDGERIADDGFAYGDMSSMKLLWSSVGTYLNEKHGVPLETVPSVGWKQAININVLPQGSRGYEWHYDSTPITAVMFPLGIQDGRFKYIEDGDFKVEGGSDVGMIYGDLSQIPHAVGPVLRAPVRISIPMAFAVPGAAPKAAESSYIFGSKKES